MGTAQVLTEILIEWVDHKIIIVESHQRCSRDAEIITGYFKVSKQGVRHEAGGQMNAWREYDLGGNHWAKVHLKRA